MCFKSVLAADAVAICCECGAVVDEAGGWVEADTWSDVMAVVSEVNEAARCAGADRIRERLGAAAVRALLQKTNMEAAWVALINTARALEAELQEIVSVCDKCRHRGVCVASIEKREVCAGVGPLWEASRAHTSCIRKLGSCNIPGCITCKSESDVLARGVSEARGTGDASPDGGDEQEHFDDPCGGRLCSECDIAGCDGPNEDEARAEALLEELIDSDTVEFFLARLVESVTIDEIADGLLGGLSTWGRGELAKRIALVGAPAKRPSKQVFVIGPNGGEEIMSSEARGTTSHGTEDRG